MLALIHPHNPAVVYFFLRACLGNGGFKWMEED
jgi:hypothetical protein